ncbi:MAG: hypothetical protein HRU38_02820 [Saccharospirillaceae bacterium]|nr:hypothetical protein [Pseudomonadales bacterium]NRB77595.1 hypothetical protein [Saccharospirillaceae bacterium]
MSVIAIVLIALSMNAQADDNADICSLGIDFPHGESRIHLKHSGEIYLFYGASPKRKKIKSGLFSINEIYGQIKDKLEPNLTKEQRSQPNAIYGMVSVGYCNGSENTYLVTDIKILADKIFKEANDNVEYEGF